MRKNSPRKWLHAFLDFLPLVVIPVFMIYSHRHTIDNYIVVRSEPLEVNAYQYVINGKPSSLSSISSDGDVTLSLNNNTFVASFTREPDEFGEVYFNCDFRFLNNHKVFCCFNAYVNQDQLSNPLTPYLTGEAEYYGSNIVLTLQDTFYSFIAINTDDENYSMSYFAFGYDNGIDNDFNLYISNVMLFDLTAIFGTGNEPTVDVFKSYLTNDYYIYGNNTLVVGMHDVTYNDTDIGSQFTYTLYNTTEKYFNFNQVFNLNGFWSWLNTNLFGGNAPLMAKSIWNIIVYEFVIDLLFLFYSFFMFLIDFTECLLDKPFNKGR